MTPHQRLILFWLGTVQYSENAQARLQRLSSVSEKCRLAEGTEL